MNEEKKYTSGYTPIPNEFIEMCFSGNVTKLYLFLMSGVNEKKWGDSRTFPSWKTIKLKTGIKSNQTLSYCINELVEFGWIKNIISRNDDSNVYFMAYKPEQNNNLIDRRNGQKESRSKAMKEVKRKENKVEKAL